MRRLLAIFLVAACLAPATWFRSGDAPENADQAITVTDLSAVSTRIGEVTLEGAWEIDSANTQFGSYSALLALGGNQLLAASDMGKLLQLPIPGAKGPVRIGNFAGKIARKKKLIDIESLTRDPVSGQIWAGYEGINAIERLDADLRGSKRVQPEEMADWSSNSGPEAMARLADGRFLVLSEGRDEWQGDGFSGLIFESDPVDGGTATRFRFRAPQGHRPVDMAQIPDGRVLILVRAVQIGIPPGFTTKLVIADPTEISADGEWNGTVIAALGAPVPSENYEGLAVVPASDGTLILWLISDDNNATFQRTLLLKLGWDPAGTALDTEKARENPRAL